MADSDTHEHRGRGEAAHGAHAHPEQPAMHEAHKPSDHPAGHAGRAGHAGPERGPEHPPRHPPEHAEHVGMYEVTGHKAADHHAMMEGELRRRFVVAAIFTVPVLLLSPTVQQWLGIEVAAFPGQDLVLFTLASVVAIYGGIFFYREAYASLRRRILDMNVLVSLAVLSGYLYSAATTFFIQAMDFYWEISTLVVFLLFGHWMEMRAVRGASGALRELVKLIPPTANLVKNGDVVETPTSALAKGDLVLVRPGEKIPIDGDVVEGETSVNEAMITGESNPVHKGPGAQVIGGAINGEGSIRVKVTKTGEETALAQIIKLVEEAQASKPPVQRLADRAAHYLTITAIVVGTLTFISWNLLGAGTLFALTLTITVLVIACPHALGLAIPTVTTISTTLAARNGLLVKNAQALEVGRTVDSIVFDKTGTLTKGEFGVTDVVETADWDRRRLLAVAAAVEVNSEHVIAKGIVNKAREEGIAFEHAKKFVAVPGKGAKAAASVEVVVGNRALMEDEGVDLTAVQERANELASQGKSIVYVASEGELKGAIALADIIRDESRAAVAGLKELGLEVSMLTGDNERTAAYVARELGLDSYFADVRPEGKSATIKGVQAGGKKVAMVGDGINDAPALIQADVGIAIGAGTDVAVESADVVLVKNDPRDVVRLINLSRRTMSKMRQNLVWATGYNAAAIPIAAGILVPFGIILRPEWAALIMAASSTIVVLNALTLRRVQL